MVDGEDGKRQGDPEVDGRQEHRRCTKCGHEKPDDGFKICVECREKAKKSIMRLSYKRSRLGLCLKCGHEKPEDGSNVCLRCRKRSNENKKRMHEKREKLGLCPVCGCEKPNDRFVLCGRCRERNREKMRRLRYKRSQLGLCIKCGLRKPEEDFKTCKWCREQNKDAAKMAVLRKFGYTAGDKAPERMSMNYHVRTNADMVRMSIPFDDLVEIVRAGGCATCKANNLCFERFPLGVSDEDCKEAIGIWLTRNYDCFEAG